MTTSLVLPPDQARLLKQVAASRMMRGTMQTASVSEVIRQLINQNEQALRAEIAGSNSE